MTEPLHEATGVVPAGADRPGEIRREILRTMERELKYLLLPEDGLPEYVDVRVCYPEVSARIRILIKAKE